MGSLNTMNADAIKHIMSFLTAHELAYMEIAEPALVRLSECVWKEHYRRNSEKGYLLTKEATYRESMSNFMSYEKAAISLEKSEGLSSSFESTQAPVDLSSLENCDYCFLRISDMPYQRCLWQGFVPEFEVKASGVYIDTESLKLPILRDFLGSYQEMLGGIREFTYLDLWHCYITIVVGSKKDTRIYPVVSSTGLEHALPLVPNHADRHELYLQPRSRGDETVTTCLTVTPFYSNQGLPLSASLTMIAARW